MREYTHETLAPGVPKEAIWKAWADVNQWPQWDKDLEAAQLTSAFTEGSRFTIRPKGGPTVKLELLRAEPLKGYTDLCRFPLARMYGIHDIEETSGGLKITIRMRVEGPLAWLWDKLVTAKVAAELPAQNASLISYVRANG